MPQTAQLRYRLRRDTMFSESPQGIYFSNSTSGFEIKGAKAYKAFCAVYPLLEGEYTEADLREALGEDAWQRMQVFIGPLRDHGYLRLVDPCDDIVLDGELEMRFDDQINFLAHFTDEPRRAFNRFRSASISVVGDGEAARAVVQALADNGAGSVTWVRPDGEATDANGVPEGVSLVLGDPRSNHDLLVGAEVLVLTPCAASSDLLLHGVDEEPGRMVLPVWAFGNELIAGPVGWNQENGKAPRWSDAVQALTDHDMEGNAAHFWSRAWAGLPTGRQSTGAPALERMIAVIAAFEVFKAVTGALEPETGGSILVLDCLTGETKRHKVLPSRVLRKASDDPARLEEIAQAVRLTLSTPDQQGLRHEPEELDGYQLLVGSRTRPVSGFQDDELEQLPLKVSAAEVVLESSRQVDVGGTDLWNVAGARLDAARHGLALYLEHWAPRRDDCPALPRRDHLSGQLRQDAAADVPVVPAFDVTSGEPVCVSQAATATLSPANRSGAFIRSCGGTGVGCTAAEAASMAVDSAAVSVALRHVTTTGAAIPLQDWGGEKETEFLLNCCQDTELEPEVLALGNWLGREVVLARVKVEGETLWEASAGRDTREAANGALAGLLGAHQRADGSTWTSLSYPDLTPTAVAVAEHAYPAYERADQDLSVIVCDVTSPELEAAGVVGCKVLIASGERQD